VPCRACLWFLRNFGSVPFNDGYLEVLGFLILEVYPKLVTDYNVEHHVQGKKRVCIWIFEAANVPVAMSLLRLIMLRRVLGFYKKSVSCVRGSRIDQITYSPLRLFSGVIL
jgi:hypothetical protein